MQQRTAAEFAFTTGSAETIGERHTGPELRDAANPQFASASASVGELHRFSSSGAFRVRGREAPKRILLLFSPRCLDYTETAVVLTNKAG